MREEDRLKRALAREARQRLKDQTSASSMMSASSSNLVHTPSSTDSTSGAQGPGSSQASTPTV